MPTKINISNAHACRFSPYKLQNEERVVANLYVSLCYEILGFILYIYIYQKLLDMALNCRKYIFLIIPIYRIWASNFIMLDFFPKVLKKGKLEF